MTVEKSNQFTKLCHRCHPIRQTKYASTLQGRQQMLSTSAERPTPTLSLTSAGTSVPLGQQGLPSEGGRGHWPHRPYSSTRMRRTQAGGFSPPGHRRTAVYRCQGTLGAKKVTSVRTRKSCSFWSLQKVLSLLSSPQYEGDCSPPTCSIKRRSCWL